MTKKEQVKAEVPKTATKKAPAKKAPAKKPKDIRKANGRVYLRKAAGFDGEIVRIIEKDEEIEVTSVTKGWAKVKEGYVSAEYLDKK